jgi:hypothetical protein
MVYAIRTYCYNLMKLNVLVVIYFEDSHIFNNKIFHGDYIVSAIFLVFSAFYFTNITEVMI